MDLVEKRERRIYDVEFGQKLTKIETIVESIEKQVSLRFACVFDWQAKRDLHCEQLEEKITALRIEQGKQGVNIGLFSIIASAILSATIAYFLKK